LYFALVNTGHIYIIFRKKHKKTSSISFSLLIIPPTFRSLSLSFSAKEEEEEEEERERGETGFGVRTRMHTQRIASAAHPVAAHRGPGGCVCVCVFLPCFFWFFGAGLFFST
jgi:hypothetical protein